MKLVLVLLNKLQFEYDILSLVKSFYKEIDVKVMHEEDESEQIVNKITKDVYEIDTVIRVRFADDSISASAYSYKEHIRCIGSSKVLTVYKDRNIDDDRKSDKNTLKKVIYELISKRLDRQLPWGTLTGIRPTKIVMGLLKEGKSDSEIRQKMKETYYISDESLDISLEIVKREREILRKINREDGYSLYIGIPFCPTTCLYCSFTSYPIKRFEDRVRAYLDALFLEIDYVSENHGADLVDTIYIGGGTPTTLNEEQLRYLLDKINRSFNIDKLLEYTVEAGRPDTITMEKLKVMKEYGVKRISINPQTMNQKTLDLIGRGHSVDEIITAFRMAKEVGIENVNMDIILGLPGEGIEEVTHTLREIKKLGPDSLTVHSLALKRASKMYEWVMKNGQDALNNSERIVNETRATAESMKMVPYYLYRQKNMAGNFENIGYSKVDMYGYYNIIIMEEVQDIIAIGAGSVSKRVNSDGLVKRCDCAKDIDLYINDIDEMINRKRELFDRGRDGN